MFTEVDLVARLSDRRLITIEMQLSRQDYYAKRAVYYVAKKYVSNYGQEKYYQGKVGQADLKYSSLYPIYGLSILDFELFKTSCSQGALRHYDLYDIKNQEYFTSQNLFKLSFLELPKVTLHSANNNT